MVFTGESTAKIVEGLRLNSDLAALPIVTITDQFPACSAVLVDDYRTGYLAAAHLLDLGHRDLLCFVSKRYVNTIIQQRMAGYRQAFIDHRLDPEVHLHIAPKDGSDPRGPDAFLADILRAQPKVTAILCPNDYEGVFFAYALKRLGYRIPEDLSLVGVDDSDALPDSRGVNILTTVRLPLVELGAESAQLLMSRIKGVVASDTVKTLPVSLVVRGTTCPPHLPRA